MFEINDEFRLDTFLEKVDYTKKIPLLSVIMGHLMKIRFSTTAIYNGDWMNEITEHKNEIVELIKKYDKNMKPGNFSDDDRFGKYANSQI